MALFTGPLNIEIPSSGGKPRKVKFLRIEIVNKDGLPFLPVKVPHLEFPVANVSSLQNNQVTMSFDSECRAVFGYVAWGIQRDDAPCDWQAIGYINWQNTMWYPPTVEDPEFVKMWLRKGVYGIWQMFEDNKMAGPVSYLTTTNNP